LYFLPVSAEANRGNVAIIVWNTLEAPYVWDVEETEFEGTINLGNSNRSLLGIYFRDFATKSGELKEIKEIDIAKANIDDRQLKLTLTEDEVDNFKFDSEPRKGKDEKSYKTSKTNVLVYVPEEVVADLDELEDECVTLILGEDNVVVAVVIEENNTEKDFLTAYDAAKEKITVGGTKYTLADDVDTDDDTTADAYGYTVELNGSTVLGDYTNEVTPIAAALAKIDAAMDVEEIEKKIQAEVTLNDDDEVKSIELTASAYIDGISDEVLVTKVKETNSKYTITTSNSKIIWDIEEEEDGEVEFPKVYVDGERADIRDIVPGMVLSVYGTDLDEVLELDDTEAYADLKIYAVTTGVVEGEASRIKKANLAVTIDGTVYAASNGNVTMSTEELSKYADASKTVASDLDAVVDNETVTLYLNMFGEYAFITLDEVASNWTFGVLTFVSSNITFEGEDEEIAVRNVKVLLDDGSKKTYKLKVDTEDDDITDAVEKLVVGDTSTYTALTVGEFVAFEADADRVITIEDGDEVIKIAANADGDDVELTKLSGTAATKVGDYAIRFVDGETTDKDDEEFGAYEFTSNTVIFNTLEKEIVAKWKSILNPAGTNFADDANTIAIFEDDDEEEALYMIVSLSDYGQEDAIYAIVEESENLGSDENYVKFVGSEEMEAKDINLLDEGWLVAYRTASSKVSEVQKLIDVENIVEAADTKTVYEYLFAQTTEAHCGCSPVNTAHTADSHDGCTWVAASTEDIFFDLATTTAPTGTKFVTSNGTNTVIDDATTMEQIVLEEVDVKASGKITLKYVETGDSETAIGSVKLDKDLIKVYDLRNGKVEEIEIEALAEEVNVEGEEVYVIAAVNGDYENDGANIVFIVK